MHIQELGHIVVDALAWLSGGSGYRRLSRLHRSLSVSGAGSTSFRTTRGKRSFAIVLD